MHYLPNILFALALAIGFGFFAMNIRKLLRNIRLGKDINRSDNKSARFKNMLKIAFGQTKMVRRPISGLLHLVVYIGFIIINIEVLEIVIDGLFGTHRLFQGVLGTDFYGFLIGTFEVLAVLVLLAVFVFWTRRNVVKLKRFLSAEMKGWPKNDGNIILYFEVVLMTLFLTMNASDVPFQEAGIGNVISQIIAPIFDGFSTETLHKIERTAWWFHILGILVFLNYLYYSKHLHILLAFPNTYFANLNPKGQFTNLEAVTKEVKLMMDPTTDPYATPIESTDNQVPEKFGASDVADLVGCNCSMLILVQNVEDVLLLVLQI